MAEIYTLSQLREMRINRLITENPRQLSFDFNTTPTDIMDKSDRIESLVNSTINDIMETDTTLLGIDLSSQMGRLEYVLRSHAANILMSDSVNNSSRNETDKK